MASYYYLISSLPELYADSEAPMTYDEFLKCCQSNVSEEKYKLLEELSLTSVDGVNGPLLKEWGACYGSLMKELNYQRSMAMGKTYSSAYDKDGTGAQVVAAALSAKNPLESEKILLDYEFELLDTLVGLHTFDDVVLFGYAIKLKLLERVSCFEHDKGKAEFTNLFTDVRQRVQSL